MSQILYPLTTIAPAVGGIVDMNIRLVSVTELSPEIGIRRDVLVQFLIKAVTLTGVGGLIGIGFISALLIRFIYAMRVAARQRTERR